MVIIPWLTAIRLFQDMALDDVLQAFRDAQLEDENNRELICALHLHFKEWLYGKGFHSYFVDRSILYG